MIKTIMTTENNKCSYCNYNRLYNFKRHMMTKHKKIKNGKISKKIRKIL